MMMVAEEARESSCAQSSRSPHCNRNLIASSSSSSSIGTHKSDELNGSAPALSAIRPRPVAKRDWPPGCGPRRSKTHQSPSNGEAIATQSQNTTHAAVLQKDVSMDSEPDDARVSKIEQIDELHDLQMAEAEDGSMQKPVMDQHKIEVVSEEKLQKAERNGEYEMGSKQMEGVSSQVSRPVAMKSVIKRKPSLENSSFNDAQASRPLAKKSTLQGGAKKHWISLPVDAAEQPSEQNGKGNADGEVGQQQQVRAKPEGSEKKPKKSPEENLDGDASSKFIQKDSSRKTDPHVKKKKESQNSKSKISSEPSPVPLAEKAEGAQIDISRFVDDPHDAEARELVCATRKTFDAIRRKLMRDEEGIATQNGAAKRSDLKAGTLMNEKKLSVNRVKQIGFVPGVEAGDHFYFRMELCIVGLHRQIQGGIDYISGKENEWRHPVAASITASGGYEEDIDDGETLIYTGQGGNNYKGDKRQQVDQKLERGNLSMDNSCRLGLPVRVIRGCKDKSSPSGTIYTYDGLYLVKESWLDRGVSGFGVYKFKLQRISGQPQLGSAIVKFVGSLKSKPSTREGMIIEDLSAGQEKVAVCVVNEVDDTTPRTDTFRYITSVSYFEGFDKPSPAAGCGCKKSCSSSYVCECISKNNQKAPYICGLLVEAKNEVYECGVQCGCPPTCHNRVTQHGIKHRLEVFKTKEKGWGVRSWDSIPSGSFICEYAGELIDTQEAEALVGKDEYLFDLDLIKGNKSRGVDVSMFFDESAPGEVTDKVEEAKLAIDASNHGNVGRFINHSCSPNLFAQCVLFDHHDVRVPHIMLFAMENIPPFIELTYDYGYSVGQVMGTDGNPKVKICHCGEKNCRGRMY